MATLRQVAELARVSISTASRALNGSDHPVSAEIRETVLAAARQLGYRPSAAAQALKQQRTRIIGVIVSDILDPYFGELTRGIEVEAATHGYVTVVANANRDAHEELRKFRVLREHRASGIVFCGSDIDGSPGTDALAREVNLAVAEGVQVIALAPRGFAAAEIVFDNEAAGYELTRYLQSLGHRQIACVGGIPRLAAVERRQAGYGRAMRESGQPVDISGLVGMNQLSGRAATETLLTRDRLPDAIVCTNDEIAIGVLATLWLRNHRIPDDVSVASIGGTRGSVGLELTAMVLPLAELGALAGAQAAAAHPAESPPAVLTCTLRVGRTTARRR